MIRKSWIEKYEVLILIVLGLIVLRMPSLFEPYWYGDEGIYLTLGMALRKGLVFYRDIHDNKPPLLYLVAALAQTQFWFRFMLLWWHAATTVVVYKLAELIFSGVKNKATVILTTVIFVALTLFFEGNIANGEIFMILPVTVGMLIINQKSKIKNQSDKLKIKTQFEKEVEKGLEFEFEQSASYFGLDRLLISGYVKSILTELRLSYSDKLRVLDVVKRFIEKKVFDLPKGMSLRLDSVDEKTDKIVKKNVFNDDVMALVKQELVKYISGLRSQENPATDKFEIKESRSIEPYQAIFENTLEHPERSGFDKQCMGNNDELRVGQLLDGCEDITGWIYNHQQGVGYSFEYLWQGFYVNYFPDFIARASEGGGIINYIIEVKGRMDERDKTKKERGEKYVSMLTDADPNREEWRYLFILENPQLNKEDIKWWENRSVLKLGDLYRHKNG